MITSSIYIEYEFLLKKKGMDDDKVKKKGKKKSKQPIRRPPCFDLKPDESNTQLTREFQLLSLV
jgi:hypothetical protein